MILNLTSSYYDSFSPPNSLVDPITNLFLPRREEMCSILSDTSQVLSGAKRIVEIAEEEMEAIRSDTPDLANEKKALIHLDSPFYHQLYRELLEAGWSVKGIYTP